ncbi:MAG: hypothetical protein VBE63_22235 [Lamprobacter sp.]|uniref:sulfotransferase family protein n=1 Tax=Lamprobacter sp. TaxID=3100796 RepID=UPI002B25EDAF|nr:hypothetical protein [Lamprobacter sp.]MEA3642637.1 hypothetical protein [Lamprobacter sp.]
MNYQPSALALDNHMKATLNNSVLIALGMHRSGTSALTGVLQCVGVHLGERLYAPQPGVNDKGFYEHGPVADINDRILYTLGSAWDDILPLDPAWFEDERLHPLAQRLRRVLQRDFSKVPLWGLKDPRMCRLMAYWLPLLSSLSVQPYFMLVVRHPMEVVGSLAKRDRFSAEKSLLLWLEHNLEAERLTRGYPRLVVTFDDLLRNPLILLKRTQANLGLEFPIPLPKARDRIQTFVTPALRRQQARELPETFPLGDVVNTVFETFLQAAASEGGEPSQSVLDSARDRLEQHRAAYPALLVEQLRLIGRQRGYAQALVDRIFASWSWPLGKPWRFLERFSGGDI